MSNVEIYMLGQFSIIVDGQDILARLGNSKKKIQFLQYIIINMDAKYTNQNLFEQLWPADGASNPESSLKTLVSRLRQDFRAFGLNSLISTKNGVYRFNREICSFIDIYRFEELAVRSLSYTTLTPEAESVFEEILSLYKGDLLQDADAASYIVHNSMHYHNLYLKSIYLYLSLLSKLKKHYDVIRVARKALEIDEFDNNINLELMSALLALNMKTEAMNQYNYTLDLHYTQLGTKPSDDILDFYKELIRMEHDSNASLNIISEELENDVDDFHAFVCDYSIFKDIYRINMRNLSRVDISILLGVITLSPSGRITSDDSLLLQNKAMNTLQETLRCSLRKGDTISRYGPSQFAVLLPSADLKTGTMIMERIKSNFYQNNTLPNFVFTYKIKPLAYSPLHHVKKNMPEKQ